MLFELHAHSNYSDGDAGVTRILEYAQSIGLDGIAITDHDLIEGSLEAKGIESGVRVITGMEISSKQGHILGLDISEPVKKGLDAQRTVDEIHSLGGLAIAAHPYDRYRRGVGDLILDVGFDAVEVVNGHTFGNKKDPRAICEKAGMPMVGGSDAHALEEVGSVLVEFEGDFRDALLAGKMRIVSRPKAELLYNNMRRIAGRGDILKRMGKKARKHVLGYK